MKHYKLLISTALTLVFDYLFWNQSLGINALVLFILITPIVLFFNKEAIAKKNVQITLVGTLVSALLVFLYGSTIASVSYLLSFTIFIGFVHQPALRTVYNSFLTSLLSLTKVIHNYIELFTTIENKKLKRLLSYIPLTLVPIIILIVFYWIFKFANPVFDDLSNRGWNLFWEYISMFFVNFSIQRFFFVLGALLLFTTIVFNRNISSLLGLEKNRLNDFFRTRKAPLKNKMRIEKFGILYKRFKNEYRIALLMTAMINGLIAIINIIDIKWIWLNFDYAKAGNLSQFVHEGTYLLILSIFISIGIILYFFRANINFLKNNSTLKTLVYLWILQNAILATSVAIRNYHYIHQNGLAYKRIGVIVFLSLVLVGLITLIVKINYRKSSFYLFRINSWAIYFVIILTSFFDWDMIIVKHNINHPNEVGIDMKFLLTLSDKTIYVLNQNKSKIIGEGHIDYKIQSYEAHINNRVAKFREEYPLKGWQSYTLAESNCFSNLIKK